MSKMKYFTPESYLALQGMTPLDLANIIDEGAWEQKIEEYHKMLLDLPALATLFYKEIGSLHDSTYSIVSADPPTFLFHRENGEDITLVFECDQYICEDLIFASEVFGDNGEPIYLYDEFQLNEGSLSFHFFDSCGDEHSFLGLSNVIKGDNGWTCLV